MHASPQSGSTSPPSTISAGSPAAPHRETAKLISSGFGAVLEQEHDLQTSTDGCIDAVNGPQAHAIGRVLRNQHLRLGDNIALLEQRHEMLPHPERFQVLHGQFSPLSKARRETGNPESIRVLPALVAQHLTVLKNIDMLIGQSPAGRQGELILSEVARNHKVMAWMLTALLNDNTSGRDSEQVGALGSLPADSGGGVSERERTPARAERSTIKDWDSFGN